MSADVRKAVHALGIDFEDTTGDELWALCPMHLSRTGKADSNPSWSINTTTGAHMCFSCKYRGNLLQLVCDVKGFFHKWGDVVTPDYEKAKYWLHTTAALEPEDLLRILEKSRRRASYAEPVPMSEARLAVFVDPTPEALSRRGLDLDSCDRYGVRWDAGKRWWITPLRDAVDARLLGWQEKGEYERYFKNRPMNMKKSLTLFGVDLIPESGPVVVVESPLDAVRVFRVTGIPAVSTCGAAVSEAQIQLLMDADTIWALDNPRVDKAGRAACIDLLPMIRKYGMHSKFFNYAGTNAKDPGDMEDEDIVDSIEFAISAVHGRRAFLT